MKPYYQDSAVTIYHGDCREISPGLSKVDLVLTDPPYKHKHVDGGGFASARAFYRDGALDGLQDFKLIDYAELLLEAARNFRISSTSCQTDRYNSSPLLWHQNNTYELY